MNKPWLKFYPADWRADPRLRMCSLAARGLWIDLISYMHEGQPYGHLTVDSVQPTLNDIAALVARPVHDVRKALAELEAKQVFSRAESGAIYSRRMVRDKAKADADARNGRDGGNPSLTKGVNPPDNGGDKAHIPEPRIQNQKEKVFKDSGKLKRDETPPRHGLATSKGGGRVYIEKGTVEWEAYAIDYRVVHGVEPMANAHGGKWFKTAGEASAA